MTSEAQEYLRKLFQKDQRKFVEMVQDSKFRITKIVLDRDSLTAEEYYQIRYFMEHGSPEIVFKFNRKNNSLNISPGKGKDFMHVVNFNVDDIDKPGGTADHMSDALSYSLNYKTDNYGIDFGKIEEDISEERLREKLKEEEARENYEMCAEIQKYAKSKGINL